MSTERSIQIAVDREALPLWGRFLIFLCLLPAPCLNAAVPVSYQNEIVPILTKAGCSSGPCHGNATGKGGFKISLRSEDPTGDHTVLTRDWASRRINFIDPDQSLLLLKATSQVSHEGGLRFRQDSEFYAALRRWIAEGAEDDGATASKLVRLSVSPEQAVLIEPNRSLSFRVIAHFSDQTERDVSDRAVYEVANSMASVTDAGRVEARKSGETVVTVRFLQQQKAVSILFVPKRENFVWMAPPAQNFIDEQIDRKLKQVRVVPSGLCTDSEFIHRVSLDLLGLLPSATDAKHFVQDPSSAKRQRLVEQYLSRPEFAEFWALKWGDLLRNEEKVLDPRGVQHFHRWMRDRIADNQPVDEFVRAILTGQGSTYLHPEASFYRAVREPLGRAEAVAQAFLGTRLQCAKCHNHPFERWTQNDYYEWAGNFARVNYRVLDNQRRDGLDNNEFNGEQVVWISDEGSVLHPKTGKAVVPRFLGQLPSGSDTTDLAQLARWLTSSQNPWFAKVQANRVWSHLFGRGVVDPIDDFRASNPGSNPELLEALAKDWVEHQFDLKHLLRTLTQSRTYQSSSVPNAFNQDDEINFARSIPRRLGAEQLLDAASQVAGVQPEFESQRTGIRAGQIPGGKTNPRYGEQEGDQFLAAFGKPERLLACECERSSETTMGQAFQLISGGTVHRLLCSPWHRS